MTPRQPIGAGRETQRTDMGCHVDAIGQKRHRAENKSGGDLETHEDGGDAGRELGAPFGLLVALAQKAVVVGPEAVVVGFYGHGRTLAGPKTKYHRGYMQLQRDRGAVNMSASYGEPDHVANEPPHPHHFWRPSGACRRS